MTEIFEDIGGEITSLVEKNKDRIGEPDNEKLNREIDILRKNIQTFLSEAKDETDKITREDALISAIQEVSFQSRVPLEEIAVLLFPQKEAFFLRIDYINEISVFGKEPFFERLKLLAIANKDPHATLKFADRYKDQPYAAEVIEIAARTAAYKDPHAALKYVDLYKDQPYAAEVIEKAARIAAQKVPGAALECADRYKDQPYAAEVIEKAAKVSPLSAYRYKSSTTVSFLKNSKNKTIRRIYTLLNQVTEETKDILYLSHYIVNGKMKIQEAKRIIGSPSEFTAKLIELKNTPNAIGTFDSKQKLRN